MTEKESPAKRGIVSLRTQLTAALLAVSLLERKGGTSAANQRLSTHALNALYRMRDELARLDRIVAQLEDREAMQADPLRLKTWRGAKLKCGEPDTAR